MGGSVIRIHHELASRVIPSSVEKYCIDEILYVNTLIALVDLMAHGLVRMCVVRVVTGRLIRGNWLVGVITVVAVCVYDIGKIFRC